MLIVLRNDCCGPFTIRMQAPDRDYTYDMKDSNGKAVKRTPLGQALLDKKPRMIFRNFTKLLLPGESVEEHVYLNEIFDLTTPGTYTVSVSRELKDVPEELVRDAPVYKVAAPDVKLTVEPQKASK